MKLLFLSDAFPDADHPTRGTYNLELCAALAREHEVRVIAPRPWIEAVRFRWQGNRYRPCPPATGTSIGVTFPTYWYPPTVFREHYGSFYWHSCRGAIRRVAESFAPDGILSYWTHPDGEAALRAARQFNVPSAVIVGGSDVLILPNCPKRGERVRHVLHESDAVITVSEGLRQRVIQLGTPPGQVHTIMQGINPRLFFPGIRLAARTRLATRHPLLRGRRPLLLWVGRMVPVKRLDVLLSAAARLRTQGRDFVLCLAGDGPLRTRIRQTITDMNLSQCVVLIGSQPPDSLGEWYRAADATVLSSESEGLPNVLRESLACGTPFVSCNVGSIQEIADPGYSVLVPPKDPAALADGMATILTGICAEKASSYQARTWTDMAEDVVALFQQHGVAEPSSKSTTEVLCHV